MERLLIELGSLHWDIIVFTETWMEASQEVFVTKHGHVWHGSGGIKGKRGVGFLLHKRWAETSEPLFITISPRLASLTIYIASISLCIIGVYMPHSKICDSEVDVVYACIDEHLACARAKGNRCIVAGDLNAEVGTRSEHDNPRIIGENSMLRRNARGEWLVQWCTARDMVVANTHFGEDSNTSWTYTNNGVERQLDYILTDFRLFADARRCYVLCDVDVGSDHRPLALVLNALTEHKSSRKDRYRFKKCRYGPDQIS